jgi:hypothetical protein
MYGEVSGWGGLRPSSYSALSRFRRDEDYNFAESKSDKVKAMYVVLWGEEPSQSSNKK